MQAFDNSGQMYFRFDDVISFGIAVGDEDTREPSLSVDAGPAEIPLFSEIEVQSELEEASDAPGLFWRKIVYIKFTQANGTVHEVGKSGEGEAYVVELASQRERSPGAGDRFFVLGGIR